MAQLPLWEARFRFAQQRLDQEIDSLRREIVTELRENNIDADEGNGAILLARLAELECCKEKLHEISRRSHIYMTR